MGPGDVWKCQGVPGEPGGETRKEYNATRAALQRKYGIILQKKYGIILFVWGCALGSCVALSFSGFDLALL